MYVLYILIINIIIYINIYHLTLKERRKDNLSQGNLEDSCSIDEAVAVFGGSKVVKSNACQRVDDFQYCESIGYISGSVGETINWYLLNNYYVKKCALLLLLLLLFSFIFYYFLLLILNLIYFFYLMLIIFMDNFSGIMQKLLILI